MTRETVLRVRYAETDQMGVAHHGSYFTWFEAARTEHMRQAGMPYRDLEARGVFLPVIEARCRYRSFVRYDDLVRVTTWVGEVRGLRITFCYRLVAAESGRLVADGVTVHTPVDAAGRPLNLPKKDPALWQRILSLLGRPA